MKSLKAFTLVEVLVSIFVFSTGMLGFMAYATRASSIMFDNESAQLAHSLALNLAEEINALSSEDFYAMCDGVGSNLAQDSAIGIYLNDSGSFVSGPFNSYGKPSTGDSYLFYRMVRIQSYGDATQTFNPKKSHLGLLRQINVYVGWPKRGTPKEKCDTLAKNEKCNYVDIPLVKPISIDPPTSLGN